MPRPRNYTREQVYHMMVDSLERIENAYRAGRALLLMQNAPVSVLKDFDLKHNLTVDQFKKSIEASEFHPK